MHENKLSLEIPSSLYIHGDVGTGKTMLMDIFYECCPEYDQTKSTRKCRIPHYHDTYGHHPDPYGMFTRMMIV